MNDDVRQWLEKAEDDFIAAGRLLDLADNACFHCQQCVEKLLKGCLLARRIDPPKIHDLKRLHRMLRHADPRWNWSEEEMDRLSGGAVIFRYPGEEATPEEAKLAFDITTKLREALMPFLEVPS